jgi:hypothetical protein
LFDRQKTNTKYPKSAYNTKQEFIFSKKKKRKEQEKEKEKENLTYSDGWALWRQWRFGCGEWSSDLYGGKR